MVMRRLWIRSWGWRLIAHILHFTFIPLSENLLLFAFKERGRRAWACPFILSFLFLLLTFRNIFYAILFGIWKVLFLHDCQNIDCLALLLVLVLHQLFSERKMLLIRKGNNSFEPGRTRMRFLLVGNGDRLNDWLQNSTTAFCWRHQYIFHLDSLATDIQHKVIEFFKFYFLLTVAFAQDFWIVALLLQAQGFSIWGRHLHNRSELYN